jgi:hypothetical protein
LAPSQSKSGGHIQLKGYLQNEDDALISICYSILRETGTTAKQGKFPAHWEERAVLPTLTLQFQEENVMRTISLVYSALAFAAMTSVAQAEPTIMKQSELMRLTAPQMDNITAGHLTLIAYASGTESSYSKSIDFSITPNPDTLVAAACCGPGSVFAAVGVFPFPNNTRFDPTDLLRYLFN